MICPLLVVSLPGLLMISLGTAILPTSCSSAPNSRSRSASAARPMPASDLDRELDHVAAVRTGVGVVGLDHVAEQHRRAAIGLRELERLVDPRAALLREDPQQQRERQEHDARAPTRGRRRRSPSRRRAARAAGRRRRPRRRRTTGAPAPSPYASRANTLELIEVGGDVGRKRGGDHRQVRPGRRPAPAAPGRWRAPARAARPARPRERGANGAALRGAILTARRRASPGRRRTTGSAPAGAPPASPPARPGCSRCGSCRPRTPPVRRWRRGRRARRRRGPSRSRRRPWPPARSRRRRRRSAAPRPPVARRAPPGTHRRARMDSTSASPRDWRVHAGNRVTPSDSAGAARLEPRVDHLSAFAPSRPRRCRLLWTVVKPRKEATSL